MSPIVMSETYTSHYTSHSVSLFDRIMEVTVNYTSNFSIICVTPRFCSESPPNPKVFFYWDVAPDSDW